ncbi:MAG: hypothetical protein U1E51_19990 [Candidatus Binatia bacterium]|nr:hypothetical protein [Candidatus Binatia bacterium]
MRVTAGQSEKQASAVPARARQGADTRAGKWTWVEATVWNKGMWAALATASEEAMKAFFAEMGLFTMSEAHTLASRSR